MQAHDLAHDIARKGGLHHITTSDMTRTQQTAMPIASASGATISVNPKLRDMAMGVFEGHKSEDVIPEINKYITSKPNEPLPGKGIQSTTLGESFNAYKGRLLPTVAAEMHRVAANPDEKRGLVINRRSLKTISAWLKAGAKPSLETDTKEATGFDKHESTSPASVHRINGNAIEDVDTKSPEPLKGGVYLIRHGVTAWNKESSIADNKDKNES